MKRFRKITFLAILFLAVGQFLFFMGDTSNPEEQLQRMSQEERDYCETVLGKITTSSTAADSEALLGKPSRDLELKKNWWVTFHNRRAGVGVNFSSDGHATEVIMSGDDYYYRRKVPAVSANNE